MVVLTAKCNRAFVVSPDKSKMFLRHKRKSNTNKQFMLKVTSKINEGNGAI